MKLGTKDENKNGKIGLRALFFFVSFFFGGARYGYFENGPPEEDMKIRTIKRKNRQRALLFFFWF
jgi:hypothetical protein